MSRQYSIQAAIAQLVEHFIRNEKVMGSSPIRGSTIGSILIWSLNYRYIDYEKRG